MKVAHIMTPNPHFLREHDSIKDATQMFLDKKINGAPVLNESGNIIGLVGNTNLYRAIVNNYDINTPVKEIMTKRVITVDINDSVFDVMTYPYSRLPVLDNGKMVGIITKSDINLAYNKILKDVSGELQAVIDSAYNAIISIDKEGIIRTFNAAAQKIYGYNKEDIIGRNYVEVFPNGKLISVLSNGRTMTGQKFYHENKTLLCNYAPIISGNQVVGAISVSQDISEIEEISRELRLTKELKDEMDAVIEASFDSFFVTDAKGKVLSINEAYTRITGIKPEEVLGRTMYELVEMGYIDRSATIEVIKTKKPVTFVQNIRNGRTMLVTGNPIFNKEGELVRVLTNGRDITELNRLKHEVEQANELNLHFQRELQKYRDSVDYVVKSDRLREIFDLVYRLGKVDSTVLILGESGVGKEIIANELHRCSLRKDRPMIRVNCAAIPESLLESELFGYEPGAFTGAKKEGKMGLFELADKGTLFLDEIGELPLNLQVKLLRVIQESEVTRLGSTKPIKVDVRLITASNRDLEEMVDKKLFRKDLFYRLNVVPIVVPPLRERREEIPALVDYFLKMFNEKYKLNRSMDKGVLNKLIEYHWPGNIRELKNVIERAVVVSQDDVIKDIDFLVKEPEEIDNASPTTFTVEYDTSLKDTLEILEKKILAQTIKEYGSSRKVAAALGMSQTSVVRKASKYGLMFRGQ